MNWVRISIFTIVIFLLTFVVGFLFTMMSLWWQHLLSFEAAFWLRVVEIYLVVLLAYIVLAVKQRERRFAHLAMVFILVESVDWIFVYGVLIGQGISIELGNVVISMLIELGIGATAPVIAYLIATMLDFRRKQE